jgi:spermidine synthase
MSYDVETLQARLTARGLRGQVELPWEIAQVLHAGWQEWFANLVARGTDRPNRDFAPYGVFESLSYWSSLNAPAVVPLLHGLGRARPWMVWSVLLVAALVIVGVRVGRGPSDGLGSALCVFGTGAAGMLFSLSVIFSFQSLFGLLFSWIGVLTAVFMAGAALGAWLMTRHLAAGPMTGHLSGGPNLSREMAISELSVLAAAVLLPLIIPLWAFLLERSAALGLLKAAFLLLPVGCGIVTGAQFPLAGRLREERIGRRTQTAGSLYAADLAGGWLGGMLGGVFLLPVLGLAGTGLTVAFLKVLTLSHLGASLRVRSKRA